jgi:hypothetical protein
MRDVCVNAVRLAGDRMVRPQRDCGALHRRAPRAARRAAARSASLLTNPPSLLNRTDSIVIIVAEVGVEWRHFHEPPV